MVALLSTTNYYYYFFNVAASACIERNVASGLRNIPLICLENNPQGIYYHGCAFYRREYFPSWWQFRYLFLSGILTQTFTNINNSSGYFYL
jgi:hypothetical protein